MYLFHTNFDISMGAPEAWEICPEQKRRVEEPVGSFLHIQAMPMPKPSPQARSSQSGIPLNGANLLEMSDLFLSSSYIGGEVLGETEQRSPVGSTDWKWFTLRMCSVTEGTQAHMHSSPSHSNPHCGSHILSRATNPSVWPTGLCAACHGYHHPCWAFQIGHSGGCS
jgi:hypothetical protein